MSERCEDYMLGMCDNPFLGIEKCVGPSNCELKFIVGVEESEMFERYLNGQFYIRFKFIRDYSRQVIEFIEGKQVKTMKDDVRYHHGKWNCITKIHGERIMGRNAKIIIDVVEDILDVIGEWSLEELEEPVYFSFIPESFNIPEMMEYINKVSNDHEKAKEKIQAVVPIHNKEKVKKVQLKKKQIHKDDILAKRLTLEQGFKPEMMKGPGPGMLGFLTSQDIKHKPVKDHNSIQSDFDKKLEDLDQTIENIRNNMGMVN